VGFQLTLALHVQVDEISLTRLAQLPPTLQWLLPDGVLALHDLLGEAEPAISGKIYIHNHIPHPVHTSNQRCETRFSFPKEWGMA
jgi:hypothetical protein